MLKMPLLIMSEGKKTYWKGIEQLKKVEKLINLSFERFSILENALKGKFTLRESSGIGKYQGNYDTFMILNLKMNGKRQ